MPGFEVPCGSNLLEQPDPTLYAWKRIVGCRRARKASSGVVCVGLTLENRAVDAEEARKGISEAGMRM